MASPTCAASRRSIWAARNSNRERQMTFHQATFLTALILRGREAPSRRIGAAPCFETRPAGGPQREAGLRWPLVICALLVVTLSPAAAHAQTAPKYEIDATWPKPLPKDWITGQLGGVCLGEQDHIYVVNRRNITDEEKETSVSAPSIIKFDMAGNVVGSWGDQTTVPGSIHGCFVDKDKNVFVAGNSDALVQKYSPDGKLLLEIGQRGKFDSVD